MNKKFSLSVISVILIFVVTLPQVGHLNVSPWRVHKDIQRVNVDFAQPMLSELDSVAGEINVPRQSLIKTMVFSISKRIRAKPPLQIY